MSAPLRSGACAILILCLGACVDKRTKEEAAAGEAPAAVPAAAQRVGAIEPWLSCIECVAHELDSAVARGRRDPAARTELGDALLGPLQAGEAVDVQLRRSHARLAAESEPGDGGDPLPGEAEYVAHYRENIANRRRVRAGIAIARIGGLEADRMLDSAANGRLRTPGDSISVQARRALVVARDTSRDR